MDLSPHRQHYPVYEIDGDLYVLDVGRELLFRYKGESRNPRALATADAVVYNDGLLTVHSDATTILLQHHVAGIEARLLAFDWLDDPVPMFEEPNALRAGDVVAMLYGGDDAEEVTA